MKTSLDEAHKIVAAARPSIERNALVYEAVEEVVKRMFGVCADPQLLATRAAAIFHGFCIEQHAIYTQRTALVAVPFDPPPPGGMNGSSGKPS